MSRDASHDATRCILSERDHALDRLNRSMTSMDPVLVWRFAGCEQPWRISSNEHGRAFDQVSVALAQVRTASGQVLTPPFRPIRGVVIVRPKRVLSLSIVYDAPEELE